jgi:hypothetical protein
MIYSLSWRKCPIDPALVGNALQHAVGIGPIEAGGREGQREGGAVDDPHPVRDPTRHIQGACGFAERGRRIHAGHRAAVPRRDPARGAANAAADVQQGLARLRVQERDQFLRRRQPTRVEMIEWGQRLRRDGGLTALDRADRRQDAAGHGTPRVVTRIMVLYAIAGH